MAANLYVSETGDDGSSGSQSQPWRTILKGLNSLNAGDTLFIRGGTYIAPNTGWGFPRGGTSANPITVTNYPGEQVVFHTPGMLTSGNYTFRCLVSNPAVDYIRLVGTDVASRQIANGPTSTKGLVITGVINAIAPAIVGYNCDNWEIAGIDFVNVGYGIFTRKVEYGAKSADRWSVHNNRVYNYFRESGMQFNGNYNTITNNEIYKVSGDLNTPYGCQLLNLLGNNNIVRGNTLSRHGSTARCIGIFFEWDLSDDNLIENNSITQVVNGISFYGGDNNIIRNNVISGESVAFNISSYSDTTTAYPCNFSQFMPREGDTGSPDYSYYYPHDCRSKNNLIENNTVSGFTIPLRMGPLDEPSNRYYPGVASTGTPTPLPTMSTVITSTPPANTNTPTPFSLEGDFNSDRKVDGGDMVLLFSGYWGNNYQRDLNRDGVINMVDAIILAGLF